jgi:hypothetical protein
MRHTFTRAKYVKRLLFEALSVDTDSLAQPHQERSALDGLLMYTPPSKRRAIQQAAFQAATKGIVDPTGIGMSVRQGKHTGGSGWIGTA